MKIDFVGIVLIIGAIQGFALAFLIFQKGRSLFANRFLYSLMLVFSVTLVSLWLSDLGYYLTNPKMMFTFEGIQLAIFPLYFLYSKYLTGKREDFDKKDWIHFLPFISYKIFLIPFYFLNQKEIFDFLNSSLISNHPLQYILFNWIIIFQGFIYLILVIIRVKKRDEFIENHFSSNYKIKLDWLKNASYLGILTTLVFLTENVLLFINNSLSETFGISSVAAGIYIYAIGYLGFSRSEVFTELVSIESKEIERGKTTNDKYEKSGLSKEKADEYYQKLIQLMEDEKIFKQTKLTLSELAEMIPISSHNLSEVINTKTEMNFFDFINRYRIEEVKKGMLKLENSNFTLLAIAMDAGFNSKSSFNTLFKKYENVTPSEYRKEYFNSKSN
ncbi:MAG: helix-turn-helix domain-containing protein [Melioribacteraceae bacterium]|nr:helix-turn-helix domain-containing protein [Melioribacteraceae bacterium]